MGFSDLSALDVNVMFVHVFILVLMGLLTALQPWVGLACSTCMLIITTAMTSIVILTMNSDLGAWGEGARHSALLFDDIAF